MKTSFVVLALFLLGVNCLPQKYYGNGMAIRNRGQHGMVFTGYFEPQSEGSGLSAQESQLNEEEVPNDEAPLNPEDIQADEESDKPEEPEAPQEEKSEEEDEEESDEDYDYWPFSFTKSKSTPVNFFPISFGGSYGRSAQGPSNVAIANSFSTGRKGVATSTATSGGPQASSDNPSGPLRSANYELRPKRQEIPEDDKPLEEPQPENETPFEEPQPQEETSLDETKPLEEPTTQLPVEATTPKKTRKTKVRNSLPNGANFFPIIFGYGGGRSLSPFGNVAIANSYSTGRKGVAMSNSRAGGLPEETKPVEEAKFGNLMVDPKIEVPKNGTEDSVEDSEESQEEDGVYVFQKKGDEAVVNFFPISFGVLGRYSVNPTTAIANSFSTGTKGVAQSTAKTFTEMNMPDLETQRIGKAKNLDSQNEVDTTTEAVEGTTESVMTTESVTTEAEGTTEGTTEALQEVTTEISTTELPTTTEVVVEVTTENVTTTVRPVQKKRTGSRALSPRRRIPSQNFFPISFGGLTGRSGGAPEGNVAIANSFSTGRGGIASSSATSYGGDFAGRNGRRLRGGN